MAAINEGDRLVVIDRRHFREDNMRVFVGVVEECDNTLVCARGYSFHISAYELSGMERRGDERLRVIAITGGDIIYKLPRDQDINRLQLKRSPKSMMLTDGIFAMDLSDFMLRG